MRTIAGLIAIVLSVACGAAWAQDVPPDQLVKTTIEDLLRLVSEDARLQSGDRHRVLEVAQEKIVPHFDFNRMTRMAVGKYWRQATPGQREKLVDEFRDLLINTYINAVSDRSYSEYKEHQVRFEPLRMPPGATEATVKIAVVPPGGQPIPVEYSMTKTANGWKAYDVKVGGISLVINYRASFSNEIQRGGIDGLIKRLAEKNQSLDTKT